MYATGGSQEFMLTTAFVLQLLHSSTAGLDLHMMLAFVEPASKQRFLNASLELDDTSARKPLISSLLEVWRCT